MRGSKPRFTDLQGQYLAFIEAYTTLHGVAPAEADMQRFFRRSRSRSWRGMREVAPANRAVELPTR